MKAGCITGQRINGLVDGVSGNWYIKFDTFAPAVERGLPVTRVISPMTYTGIADFIPADIDTVGDHHNEDIFSHMVGIMELIFEESEDISINMLKPLLFSIKNDTEGVLPEARKLGERVLKKSGAILRLYLRKTLTNLGDILDNYSPVLTSICEGKFNFEQNDSSALVQQQTDDEKLAKECSENAPQENIPQADASKITSASLADATQFQLVRNSRRRNRKCKSYIDGRIHEQYDWKHVREIGVEGWVRRSEDSSHTTPAVQNQDKQTLHRNVKKIKSDQNHFRSHRLASEPHTCNSK